MRGQTVLPRDTNVLIQVVAAAPIRSLLQRSSGYSETGEGSVGVRRRRCVGEVVAVIVELVLERVAPALADAFEPTSYFLQVFRGRWRTHPRRS